MHVYNPLRASSVIGRSICVQLGGGIPSVPSACQILTYNKEFYHLEFRSMFLVLTLLYLFHGFQTHAAPLTTLLADSGSNATVLCPSDALASACKCDQRSIWDILWSCLATIFACSWVSIHPNIPAPNESSWRVFFRRLELMFWAVVGPEMVIAWAFRQWSSARHLEKLYKGEW